RALGSGPLLDGSEPGGARLDRGDDGAVRAAAQPARRLHLRRRAAGDRRRLVALGAALVPRPARAAGAGGSRGGGDLPYGMTMRMRGPMRMRTSSPRKRSPSRVQVWALAKRM